MENPEDDTKDVIDVEAARKWGGEAGLIDFPVQDDRIMGWLPVDRLARHFDPFENSPWHDGQGVTREGVVRAIDEGRLERAPYSVGLNQFDREDWSPQRHEERIAYLVIHQSDEPISVEFSHPDFEGMSIDDGNHRLAAAIVRDDADILIEIGGYISNCVQAIGIIVRDYQKLGIPADSECYDLMEVD